MPFLKQIMETHYIFLFHNDDQQLLQLSANWSAISA